MITEIQAKKLIDIALAHGKNRVDGMEVHVSASDVATSRFANNEMTQNQSPSVVSVSVRVITAGKQARLSTDRIAPSSIRELVDNAITAAGFLEQDPDILPVFDAKALKRKMASVNRYDKYTATMGPNERAALIKSIIDIARDKGLNASGVYASGTNVSAIGNSKGLFAFYRETEAECSLTMTAQDSSGWAKAHSPQSRDIDVVAMARSAADKAVRSANPVEVPPGKYTVVLEPSAVLDLLIFLWYDFAGTAHTDKLSCLLDKVGQKLLGQNITITDDVSHPLQCGAPFDGEGVPRSVVTLVENGVVKNLVHGRRSAAKFQTEPTGHGMPEPAPMGEYPVNIVIAGGNSSLDEMIRSTDRGILLTRVWYVREVDPTSKIETGMTRDGTFLIENGEIKSGVKNFRFNESLLEMLRNVVALGLEQRTAGEEGFPAVVPAMKVENFNFSSVTKF